MYEKQAAYILILMMYLYIFVLMLPSKLWPSLCACLCLFVLTPQCWRGRCCPSAEWAGARIGSLTCPRTGEPPLDWIYWARLKSALRPPPSARAESANFRPFYVKRADFSPPPPATKKRRKLVKIRPRCPHLATKKRRKVVKIRPCGGWWVGGWFPPPLFL